MNKNFNEIRKIIDSAKQVLNQLNIDYNSLAGPKTYNLVALSRQIVPLIKEDYPAIANIIGESTRNIINRQTIPQYQYGPPIVKDYINAYAFGDLRTTFKILDSLYPHRKPNTYKIFISHSSADETIVNGFIKSILMLGCGLKRTDIFCTLDHTVIRTGDDFRSEIIENMKSCDFIFCMISENYRMSEVCQNELGAAWALDNKRILPFKFPNIKFTEIGFLNTVKQAADISDTSKLDELYDELCKSYEIQPDWVNFNKQKNEFVNLTKVNCQ